MSKVAIGDEHFEFRIKAQERLKQILFGPKAKFIHHPVAAIIERKENVVNVHDDTRFETRQHLQEQVVNVAANLHGMRAVDEKNVAVLKLGEEFKIDILHVFL